MTAANGAVRSFFNMHWTNVSYATSGTGKAKSQKESLEQLSCLSRYAGQGPLIVFIRSSENETRGDKVKASRQKEKSNSVEAEVFDDEKFRMQICSRYFKCLKMDVTSIDREKNAYLCSEKAPLIAIFSEDGKLIGAHRRGAAAVYSSLRRAAKPHGIDLDPIYRATYRLAGEMYKKEKLLYNLRQDLKEAQQKKNPKLQERAREKVDACVKEIVSIKSECFKKGLDFSRRKDTAVTASRKPQHRAKSTQAVVSTARDDTAKLNKAENAVNLAVPSIVERDYYAAYRELMNVKRNYGTAAKRADTLLQRLSDGQEASAQISAGKWLEQLNVVINRKTFYDHAEALGKLDQIQQDFPGTTVDELAKALRNKIN